MTRYWTASRSAARTPATPVPVGQSPSATDDATCRRLAGAVAAAVAGLGDTDRPDLWRKADRLRGAWAAYSRVRALPAEGGQR